MEVDISEQSLKQKYERLEQISKENKKRLKSIKQLRSNVQLEEERCTLEKQKQYQRILFPETDQKNAKQKQKQKQKQMHTSDKSSISRSQQSSASKNQRELKISNLQEMYQRLSEKSFQQLDKSKRSKNSSQGASSLISKYQNVNTNMKDSIKPYQQDFQDHLGSSNGNNSCSEQSNCKETPAEEGDQAIANTNAYRNFELNELELQSVMKPYTANDVLDKAQLQRTKNDFFESCSLPTQPIFLRPDSVSSISSAVKESELKNSKVHENTYHQFSILKQKPSKKSIKNFYLEDGEMEMKKYSRDREYVMLKQSAEKLQQELEQLGSSGGIGKIIQRRLELLSKDHMSKKKKIEFVDVFTFANEEAKFNQEEDDFFEQEEKKQATDVSIERRSFQKRIQSELAKQNKQKETRSEFEQQWEHLEQSEATHQMNPIKQKINDQMNDLAHNKYKLNVGKKPFSYVCAKKVPKRSQSMHAYAYPNETQNALYPHRLSQYNQRQIGSMAQGIQQLNILKLSKQNYTQADVMNAKKFFSSKKNSHGYNRNDLFEISEEGYQNSDQ